MGIDAPVVAHADLREPDVRDHRRLLVAQLERYPDAADEPIAIVPQRALTHEKTLHRRVGDAVDLSRPGALEKPQGLPRHHSDRYHVARSESQACFDERVQRATASSMRALRSVRWQCAGSVQADEQSSVTVSPARTRPANSSMRGRC